MAVEAYPKKEISLFVNSLFRRPTVGELDVYESISKSVYQPSMKFSFASIPGPIAFLYYTNSLAIVFVGMALFTVLMKIVDFVVFRNFKNCFLSVQLGFYLANSLAQSGLSPRPLLISFLMTTCGLVVLKIFILFCAKRADIRTKVR
ncbi:MAG: hypothetical protein IPM97_04605 [Bdellovibrionaceae bacterium]|nr:hypothetical protein [Pseudobdellovibrionaceae bacterium]